MQLKLLASPAKETARPRTSSPIIFTEDPETIRLFGGRAKTPDSGQSSPGSNLTSPIERRLISGSSTGSSPEEGIALKKQASMPQKPTPIIVKPSPKRIHPPANTHPHETPHTLYGTAMQLRQAIGEVSACKPGDPKQHIAQKLQRTLTLIGEINHNAHTHIQGEHATDLIRLMNSQKVRFTVPKETDISHVISKVTLPNQSIPMGHHFITKIDGNNSKYTTIEAMTWTPKPKVQAAA